jgi:hypothetical protein
MTGWLKLWRKFLCSDVWDDGPVMCRLWIWILLHANYEPTTWKGIELDVGELFTSYNSIAEGIAWADEKTGKRIVPLKSTIRYKVKLLADWGNITAQAQHGGLVIKVLHWEDYQGNGTGTDSTLTAHLQHEDSTLTAPDTTVVSTVKEEKKETYTSACKQVFDHWKTVMEKDRSRFTAEKRRHIEARLREGFTVEELKQVVTAAKNDPFTMGDNDRNKAFNEIDNLYRNATRVEKFLGSKPRRSGLEMVAASYE